MREPPILATATILKERHHHLYDAELPNGKIVIAHVPKWLASKIGNISAGSKVVLELTVYDFSTARIAGLAEEPAAAVQG